MSSSQLSSRQSSIIFLMMTFDLGKDSAVINATDVATRSDGF
jgi:hypothetical protein